MTLVELRQEQLQVPRRSVSAAERRAEAQDWIAAAMAAGREPSDMTGADVGEAFGMSPSWGRAQLRAVPAAAATEEPATSASASSPVRRRWYAVVFTGLVGLVAAAASYGHMLELARAAGEPEMIAWILPLSVDGLVVAALLAGPRGRWWLAGALAASVAANIASADPTVIGRLVAAWPPVALLGTHRLLYD